MECLEASMAGKSEEMNVLTSSMEFGAKPPHALPVAYCGEDLAEKWKSHLSQLLADMNLTVKSRRILPAIFSLDRSISETLKDKLKIHLAKLNKSRLAETDKEISSIYLN